MKFGKITIIGSGRVGTSAAFALICQNIAKEIALLDINEDVLDAESIDLRDAKYFSYTGHIHKGSWEHAKDSQIIVICAGEVLRPESSLHQVVASNKRCLDDIFRRLGTLHSKCVVVVATSPVDAMTQYAQKLSGLPRNQVLGTGTLLDTQRLRVKLGKKFQINEKSVHAYVMGEKGDTAFVPWSHATIAGRKLTEFFAEDRETQSQLLDTFLDKIKTKTERMLWSKHGTNFGIAACIAAICKDILFDSNSVLPLSCYVNDFDCYMSVLCTLGENGIAKTLPLDLTEMEKQRFQLSANSIWKALKLLGFQNDRFGAVGEEKEWRKEGLEEKTEGLAPGAGFGTEVRGRPMEVPAQEIGGGLGTDIGGFGQTGFQPLQTDLEGGLPPTRQEFKKEELGARPYESGTALSSTDIRGFDIGGKTTELGRDLSKETTKLNEDRVGQDLGGGPVGQKLELPTDRGDTGEVGGEKSETGFEKIDIGGTTDIEKKPQTEIGKEISDIGGGLGRAGEASPKLSGMDTSFGGGPTVRGTDIQEGLIKDIGGGEMEKKPLITETQEGRVDEPVGRPIRQ